MTFKDPHSYADVAQGIISHIDLAMTVDFSTRRMDIEAHYQLDRAVNGSLYLDTNKLDIQRIHSNDVNLAWEFDESDAILGERLHIKEMDGVTEFSVTLTTSDEASALQWAAPVQTSGGKHPFLYSQCQPIHARSLFPCQDTPSVRFTYTASLEVPRPLTGVMAAEHLDTEERNGSQVFRFRMPQPIPSYLFALAAGNLEFREIGPRTGVYAEPEMIEAAVGEFEANEARIEAAEKLLGPYLWERYDILMLPPSFPYGGMENPRLTFFNSAIVGSGFNPFLVAHELAHAWTGNLVTNATWEHFWLNEGWTTYVQDRIAEVVESPELALTNRAWGASVLEQTVEQVGHDSELTRLRMNMDGGDPDDFVTLIPYFKGSSFIVALEEVVGRERFDAFIQAYIGCYQFQSLTTEEFLEFLRRELPEAARTVNIQNWLYDTGLPEEGYQVQSRAFDEVLAAITSYGEGELPSREQVAEWNWHQTENFLAKLPREIPVEDCAYFDDLFDLAGAADPDYLMHFFDCCVRSGHQEVLPRIEAYLGRIGRKFYIAPVYRALAQTEWSKPHARRIFDEVRERYHPIIAKLIDNVLSEAGL